MQWVLPWSATTSCRRNFISHEKKSDLLQLENLQSIKTLQFWEDAILHIAHRTKSRKSCYVLHIALRHTDLQKSPFFFFAVLQSGRRPELAGRIKRSFRRAGLDSWFPVATGSISVPSELSAYPDFKTHHRQMPDDCLASKKNHIEQKIKTAKSFREQSRRRYLVYLCIL